MVWANAISATSCGYDVRSETQSRNVLRNPCGTALTCIRLNTKVRVISERGVAFDDGKTKSVPATRGKLFNSITAASDKGTLCSLAAFMRSAGIVHIFSVRS